MSPSKLDASNIKKDADIVEDKKSTSNQGPVTKEKLRSIMEAASALTALQDEDNDNNNNNNDKVDGDDENNEKQRFIPDHKKPDAALTFPEKVS